MESVNLCPFVVSSASPVLALTVKPENVIAPALAPFVTSTRHDPSFAGAASVNAPLLVTYCCGHVPQSMVSVPLDLVPRLDDTTLAPPDIVWSTRLIESASTDTNLAIELMVARFDTPVAASPGCTTCMISSPESTVAIGRSVNFCVAILS